MQDVAITLMVCLTSKLFSKVNYIIVFIHIIQIRASEKDVP